MEPIAKLDDASARLAKIRQAILKRFPRNKSSKHALLKQALQDAEFYHGNQFRKSGEPAIIHPYRVALLVSEAGMGVEAVIIALLHDIIEDTEFTKDEMAAKYGDWLAEAVDGLTKVAASSSKGGWSAGSIATYRKLLISSVKDLRTLQVKIFDRLDNMRDLGFLSRASQRRIAMETMQVYLPMAQRLGLQDISDELGTLCFRYLYPKRFNRLLEDAAAKYGDWLAEAVDGLTKVAASSSKGGWSAGSIATYRKLLISSVKDLRTLQVKIFDRLDNMRDLGFLSRASQRRIAMETMQVYLPMAQRLGLQDISDELGTLCFRYLYPKRFNRLLGELKQRKEEEQKKVRGVKRMLDAALKDLSEGRLSAQPKYHKISDYVFEDSHVGRPWTGFTVTVPNVEDCYAVLGKLHREYRVVPNSIRDYISNPKPNRHQSLESKIFIGGEAVSIEIFSKEMEAVNRAGILADWQASHEEVSRYYESYLELLEQFNDSEDLRMEDVLRYGQMETLQIFTPIGEMLNFPQRSTVLDFAFAIHTDLGLHCEGALVDGRRAQRTEELRDGTMVEVLTAPNVVPNASWLGHVRAVKSKMAIRRCLRDQRLSRAEEVGRKLFLGVLKRLGLNSESFVTDVAFQQALKKQKLSQAQFFQRVGTRQLQIRPFLQGCGIVPDKVLERLDSQERVGLLRFLTPRFKSKDPDLKISELGDAFIHLAPCCSPLQGDAIVGAQQDNGILIHRAECEALAR